MKTARKGVGEFVVTAHGISAHAGANPGAGASAIHEIARHVTTIEGWSDPARGLTVNVGVIDGGLRSNVVAETARAVVDVRVARLDDAASIEAAFRSLAPVNPRVRLEVTGGINRPPMERTAGVAQALRAGARRRARRAARIWRKVRPAARRTETSPRRWASQRWMVSARRATARTRCMSTSSSMI